MDVNPQKLIGLLILLVIALIAYMYFTTDSHLINVDYMRTIPEEYGFKIKANQYVPVDEIPIKTDLKKNLLVKIGLEEEYFIENQAFNIKISLPENLLNTTTFGLEYSNKVFLYVRPIANHTLVFTYDSPDDDEKTLKKYLLNNQTEIQIVGLINELTVTDQAPRSIKDSMRITIYNTSTDRYPTETLDYRILVCSKTGC